MAKPTRKIAFRDDESCPCGSGKLLLDCHMGRDGRFWSPRPSLRPPGLQTGYAHPACYLRDTKDCSEQISGEHYVSRSVLEQLGTMLRVSGLPWRDANAVLETTAENLTAKILCRRHNEALSPLDTEAASFFSHLTEALRDLNRQTLSRRPVVHVL